LLPAIGRSRRGGTLLYAFGHQHLGLTLAPITAELVAALANEAHPDIDLTPFDLERFGGKGGRA
jgi:D-amino-acid dehydrogenase